MARMIPGYLPEDAPPGEKAVYIALAESVETDNWYVLHSLAIAEHIKKPEGEADFVIIAPGKGILVIEVKSHDYIHVDKGTWQLGTQKPTTRGPFKQANEAMYSIRKHLMKNGVRLHEIPTLNVVWFTSVRARTSLPVTAEWNPWQVLDRTDLQTGPIAAVNRAFSTGTTHLVETVSSLKRAPTGPDQSGARQIVRLLRPSFEVATVARDVRSSREGQLRRFLEEQFDALDAMSENRAVLFSGPAGSGKTLLAAEAARRELAAGASGRLICFNRFLGSHLKAVAGHHPRLAVGTLHSQMLAILGEKAPPNPVNTFWYEELPERALDVLLEARYEDQADFLIVDEFQDLLSGPYVDVLDSMVKDGLDGGRVLLFADFERQTIFASGDHRSILQKRFSGLPSYKLVTNCRNLPRIGYGVNVLSRLKPGYTKFRRLDDGINPQWRKYRRGADQSAILRDAVETLRDEKYTLEEIVVLSPLASRSVAETTRDPWLRQILEPYSPLSLKKGRLSFCSIQSFKGLESTAVIVTDLDRQAVPGLEALMYVGLTRATDRVIGIMEESTGIAGLEGKL